MTSARPGIAAILSSTLRDESDDADNAPVEEALTDLEPVPARLERVTTLAVLMVR